MITAPRSRPRADGLDMGAVIGVDWAFLLLAGTVVERPSAGAEPSDLGTSCTLAVEGRDFA